MARGLANTKKAESKKPATDPAANAAAAAGPAAGAAPATAEAAVTQGQQASPEEQAAYENFINMSTQLIYADDKVNPAILERLAVRTEGAADESQQAIEALAGATVAIVTRVQDSIKQGGGKIDPVVMYHAGAAVMEDLADLAGRDNPVTDGPIHDYTPEEMKGAWIRAVDLYQQQQSASGDLPKGVMNNDWGQIVGAEKAGGLGKLIPALAGAEKEAPVNG